MVTIDHNNVLAVIAPIRDWTEPTTMKRGFAFSRIDRDDCDRDHIVILACITCGNPLPIW